MTLAPPTPHPLPSKPSEAEMNRVEITRPFAGDAGLLGICMMQVCAVADATDDEILRVCNERNPSGTTNGWTEVVRDIDEDSPYKTANKMPVKCDDCDGRMHFLVLC